MNTSPAYVVSLDKPSQVVTQSSEAKQPKELVESGIVISPEESNKDEELPTPEPCCITKDIIKFRSEAFKRPPITATITEQEDGEWDCDHVVISPGDRVRWSWSSDRCLVPGVGICYHGPTEEGPGEYTHQFGHVGRFEFLGANDTQPGCSVVVICPSSWRTTARVLAGGFFMLVLAFGLPLALASGLTALTRHTVANSVMRQLGLGYATLEDIVKGLIENFVFYVYVCGLVALVLISVRINYVALRCAGLTLMIKRCFTRCCFKDRTHHESCLKSTGRRWKKWVNSFTEAGFVPKARGCFALFSLILMIALSVLAARLVHLEQTHSSRFVSFMETLRSDMDAERLQALQITKSVKTLYNARYTCNCSIFSDSILDEISSLVDVADGVLGMVQDYSNKATNIVWVYTMCRAIFSFISFAFVGGLLGIGFSGLLSLRTAFMFRALQLSMLAFCATMLYLGINETLQNAISEVCGIYDIDAFAADPVAAAEKLSGAEIPAFVKIFTQCAPSSEIPAAYGIISGALSVGIGGTMTALDSLLPDLIKIDVPSLSNTVNPSVADVAAFLDVAQNSTFLAQAQEQALLVANTTNARSATSPLMLALQLRVAFGGLHAVVGLADCTMLKYILGDVVNGLCGDIGSTLSEISGAIGVVLWMLILCVLAIGMQSHSLNHPNKRFRCPDAACGRWFRFAICFRAHRRVGCEQTGKLVSVGNASRFSNMGFHLGAFCALAIFQGAFLLLLGTSRQGLACSLMVAPMLGALSTLSKPNSWVSILLRGTCTVGVVVLVAFFCAEAADNIQNSSLCGPMTISALLNNNGENCSMKERTGYVTWALYFVLAAVYSLLVAIISLIIFIKHDQIPPIPLQRILMSVIYKGWQQTHIDQALVVELQGDMHTEEPLGGIHLNPLSNTPPDEDETKESIQESTVVSVSGAADASDLERLAEKSRDKIRSKMRVLHRTMKAVPVATLTCSGCLVVFLAIFLALTVGTSRQCNGISCDLSINKASFSLAYMAQASNAYTSAGSDVTHFVNVTKNITVNGTFNGTYIANVSVRDEYPQHISPMAQSRTIGHMLHNRNRAISFAVWPCPHNATLPVSYTHLTLPTKRIV
eukprot:TRINITY_DN13167_c0_g1_i3.p1 TRINITY_DN13167_c0_g1~~TRINITY_DN13167_c0_g1_i3.p1  ORF type:complete len:1105 (-),score=223.01 TRINITY_DN13167_c0_g1_i3:104-3418(-)